MLIAGFKRDVETLTKERDQLLEQLTLRHPSVTEKDLQFVMARNNELQKRAERAEHELFALRSAGTVGEGWQPIETAPKDGRVLGTAEWFDVNGIAGWLACGLSDPPGNLGLAAPTRWMPLPDPPTTPERA
jgi:hypothetical protein